jgi:hypothetical protein
VPPRTRDALTGQPPFSDDDATSVMDAHLHDKPPTVTARRPELPRELDEVLAVATAKDRDERFASCGQMLRACREALRQTTPKAPEPDMAPAADVTVSEQPPTDPDGSTGRPIFADGVAEVGERAAAVGRPMSRRHRNG